MSVSCICQFFRGPSVHPSRRRLGCLRSIGQCPSVAGRSLMTLPHARYTVAPLSGSVNLVRFDAASYVQAVEPLSGSVKDRRKRTPALHKKREGRATRRFGPASFIIDCPAGSSCRTRLTAQPGKPEPRRRSLRGDSPPDNSDSNRALEWTLWSERPWEPARGGHSARPRRSFEIR
jgi:hypothetical protein